MVSIGVAVASLDSSLCPAEFSASTSKVYGVPLVSPVGSALNSQPRGPQAGQRRRAPGPDRRWRAPVPRAPAFPRRPARPGVAHRCRHFPSRARARPSEPSPRPNRHLPSPASHSSGPGIRAALRGGAGPRRDARRGSILDQTKNLIHLSVTIVLVIRITLAPMPGRHESAAIRGATGAGPAGLVRTRSRADFGARCRPAGGAGEGLPAGSRGRAIKGVPLVRVRVGFAPGTAGILPAWVLRADSRATPAGWKPALPGDAVPAGSRGRAHGGM